MTDRPRRLWLIYWTAWLPILVAHLVLLLVHNPGIPIGAGLRSALMYTATAALLGVPVWWVTRVVPWRQSRTLLFFTKQTLLALVYSSLLTSVQVLYMIAVLGVQTGWNISKSFIGWQNMSGIWLYGMIAGVFYGIRAARRLQEQEAVAARAEVQRVRAELQALRGQLNPHFLFNTLHTMSALVRSDPQQAERALDQFGDLLHYVLDVNADSHDEVPFADEWKFVRNYLGLERLRLGDRLEVIDDVAPESLDCLVPAFTVQPLVENAVRHGIAPNANGGTIQVSARVDGSNLVIRVRDSGGSQLAVAQARGGTGVGLRAVSQRLTTRYGSAAHLEVEATHGQGYEVTVSLPAHAA
jgi:two-component system, LytTR family, sensor kinase